MSTIRNMTEKCSRSVSKKNKLDINEEVRNIQENNKNRTFQKLI